ncbi:hypothetical protein EP331_11610 [bacterium]|nr:MAG: hypothetical protein EP331_11610 [bacterium]
MFTLIIYVLVSVGVSYFLPWWVQLLLSVLFGFLLKYPFDNHKFLLGFKLTGLVWLGLSLVLSWQNDFLLSSRIAEVFMLPHQSLLFVIHFFIGGLLGGAGFMLSSVVKHK